MDFEADLTAFAVLSAIAGIKIGIGGCCICLCLYLFPSVHIGNAGSLSEITGQLFLTLGKIIPKEVR